MLLSIKKPSETSWTTNHDTAFTRSAHFKDSIPVLAPVRHLGLDFINATLEYNGILLTFEGVQHLKDDNAACREEEKAKKDATQLPLYKF